MIGFLRRLTPDQQVTALFLLVFGVLALASAALLLLSMRERDPATAGGRPSHLHCEDEASTPSSILGQTPGPS